MKLSKMCLLAFVEVLSSCSTYSLMPQASDDTGTWNDSANQVIHALKSRIGVSVLPEVVGNLIYFHTIVTNFRDSALHVDTSSVKLAEQGTSRLTSEQVRVYGADEYYTMRESQIMRGPVIPPEGEAHSVWNTSQSQDYYSGYDRNRYYKGHSPLSPPVYTDESAKAAIEQEIAFAKMKDYAIGTNQELEYLRNTLFYPSVIDPGSDYYGIIVAEAGRAADSRMDLTIDLAGESFRFLFQKQQRH